jgi:tRNA modification GTPase
VDLLDAAGFAQTDDDLAGAADHAARNAVARAEAILFVRDAAEPSDQNQTLPTDVRRTNPHAPILILENKSDLAPTTQPTQESDPPVIRTSAITGEGLDEVRANLTEILHLSAQRPGDVLALHVRQRRCLLAAATATERAAELLAEVREIADAAELVAVELREALAHLGRISGAIADEDILARIFARFCVGK